MVYVFVIKEYQHQLIAQYFDKHQIIWLLLWTSLQYLLGVQ